MPGLTVTLLGYPEVYVSGERLKLPTQKVQAILYFLAVKHQTTREELAELLWTAEARHRLRPELYRLRHLPQAELWLSLDDSVIIQIDSDLAHFEQCIREKNWQKALEYHRDTALLLQGFSLEDAPQFMDWLEAERARVTKLYREALWGRALELARQDQLGEALDLLNRLIDLDPLDESAYRSAMRLEYARGHVQAALQQFERCRRVLAEELGLDPSEELLDLATEIQKGSALPEYQIDSQSRLPKALLRPPHLIGREAEWEKMEAAFQAGQAVFVSGPAGSGKTRLMLDFARSKGDVVMAEGRIGDIHIPGSTVSRVVQHYIEAYPDRALEPWIKQELSSFLYPDKALPQLTIGDKTRMYQAVAAFFAHAGELLNVFPSDNLHYFDPLSAELTNQAAFEFFSHLKPGRCAINTFRPESMPPDFFPLLEHFIAQGTAVHIELKTLNLEAIRELLASLELAEPEHLAETLQRLTGGNPQFIIETLKSLHATGQLDTVPERITLPERLAYILRKRLDGLSPLALRIAKTVATLEQQLDTETLAELLELNAFDIAEGIAELENAQVFIKNQFVHDLLQETTKQQTPAAVQRLLHKRRAGLLERQGLDAVRIAHHYLAADEREKALPWRLKAIEDASHQGFRSQAYDWLEALLFEVPQESKAHAHALVLKGQLLVHEDIAAAEICYQEVLTASRYRYRDLELAALEGLANCARRRRDFVRMHDWLKQALELSSEATQKARLYHLRAVGYSFTGQLANAETGFQQAIELDPERFLYQLDFATFRWHQGRIEENISLLIDLLRQHPEQAQTSPLYHNIGTAYWVLGKATEALSWTEKSLSVWQDSGNLNYEAMTRLSLGSIYLSLGQCSQALESFRYAERLFGQMGASTRVADTQSRIAYLYALGHQWTDAPMLCQTAIEVLRQHDDPFLLGYALAFLAHIQTGQGNLAAAQTSITQALSATETSQNPVGLVIILPMAAEIRLLAGERNAAEELNSRAHNLARQIGAQESLANTLVLQAKIVAGKAKAKSLLEQALDIANKNHLAFSAFAAASYLCQLEGACEQKGFWLSHLHMHAPESWVFEQG